MPTTALRIWNGMKKMEGESNAGFWKNVAALIKVKTIVTLVVVAVFAILALRGGLQPDTVMTIVTMVVAFYFGTQTEGKSNGK